MLDKEKMNLLEVLCINDGSPDHSSEIAKQFQAKYPATYRVIDKTNGNYGSCINRGLDEAKGLYFKVCDGDDYYNTEALEKLIEMLGRTDADMVISSYQEVDEQGEVKHTYVLQDELLGKVWQIEDVDIDRFYLCLYAKTMVFVKDIVYCYRLGVNGQTMDPRSLMKHYKEIGIVEYGLLKEYNTSANNSSEAKKKMLRVLWLYLEIIFTKVNFHQIKNAR